MSEPTYLWRKLTPKQREDLMAWRKQQGLPWHRPPHRASEKTRYHITAACFEHRHFIEHKKERLQRQPVENSILKPIDRNTGIRQKSPNRSSHPYCQPLVYEHCVHDAL